MLVTVTGYTWIYPSLVYDPTSATFDVTVSTTPPSLILGTGTMTIGANTYDLSFNQGALNVEPSEFANPFSPFAVKSITLTSVVAATLRTDGAFFADGTGVFQWIQDTVTSGPETQVYASQFLDLRLVNVGQLYNVSLFGSTVPEGLLPGRGSVIRQSERQSRAASMVRAMSAEG